MMRQAHDAFNRGDFEGWATLADPDIEIRSLIAAEVEGSGPYRGLDGLRMYWEMLFGLAPDLKFEADEVRDLGDFTVSRIHLRGHGSDTGAPIDQVAWQIGEWRDGKCVRLSHVLTEAEAQEAAGLSE